MENSLIVVAGGKERGVNWQENEGKLKRDLIRAVANKMTGTPIADHQKNADWEAEEIAEELIAIVAEELIAIVHDDLDEAAIRADEREACAKAAHEAWMDGVPPAEIAAAIRSSNPAA